ncbi:hypothetical protein E3N88_38509 [Mikania micrantha]|uniref:Phospholipid/glycerol acyltransferase domain-containing protein n=1 Tax=Mikania micrantha TaxID=192012 RepID=A0A5N6LWR8_9ASTR|nr:hypothetical protein E3N88_38509 [Mikania micrantha]
MALSVVSELEGTLLKNKDPFSYFMLVAFEASGLIRFTCLLLFWPVIKLLDACGKPDVGLKVAIFIATVGVPVSEIESVARAVLPKFYFDDIDLEAWKVFNLGGKRVVVTKIPTVLVERFVKEHLLADEVVGTELVVSRFGLATGLDQVNEPYTIKHKNINKPRDQNTRPVPVIFHDGRLVKRPTPSTALLILIWTPIGVILAIIRILIGAMLPMWAIPYVAFIFGSKVIVKGVPPSTPTGSNGGVLFVCTHRTLMDPVVLSTVLQRSIPAVTYSVSRLSEILSPIPTVRLTRIRHVDAEKIRKELSKGDLVVCPEGTTCREPFLLRFSALFAELTDRIVPVAMNYRVSFFHATTAKGWKGLDPIFFFMNPRPVYEVTFLNQLPAEATCSSGKSPHDVANYVQRILAATLGFECTNFTRKDKYRVLAGNDGTVSYTTMMDRVQKMGKTVRKVVGTFEPFVLN